MQVLLGEREKKMIKLGISLFRTKFGKKARPKEIHKALVSLNIPSASSIVSIINETADNQAYPYQSNMLRNYSELGIWVLINHPDLSKAFNRILARVTGKEEVQVPIKTTFSKLDLYLMKKILLYIENRIKYDTFSRYNDIHSDMQAISNKAVNYVFNIVQEELDSVNDEDLKRISVMFAEMMLWIVPRDTAYRDPFFWSLNKIGNPSIRKCIKEHPTRLVKHPKDWYGAVLFRARDKTQELRKSGELDAFEFSESEGVCVPHIASKAINKMIRGK